MKKLWSLLILLSLLGCTHQKKRMDMIFNSFEVGQMSKFEEAYFTSATTEQKIEKYSLTENEKNTLWELVTDPDNHMPRDLRKKCRFDPDVLFEIKDREQTEISIYICQNCKTWQLTYKGETYLGNYDEGHNKIESFISGLHDKNQTFEPKERDALEKFKELNVFMDEKLIRAILAISDQTFLESFSVTEKTGLVSGSKQRLNKEKSGLLRELLLDRNNYGFTKSFRLCSLPVTKEVTSNYRHRNSLRLLIKKECDQIILITEGASLTLDCPILIQKMYNIL